MKSLFVSRQALEERKQRLHSIYVEHQGSVRKLLYWMADAAAVDDLVQEVFLRIWKSLDRFEGRSELKTWIRHIAINVARDYRHKAGLNRQRFEALEEPSEFESPELGAEVELASQDLVDRAFETLSPEQRAVFVLFYQEDQKIDEIAVQLEVPVGTVKSRLNSGREKLRGFLENQEGEVYGKR